MNDEKWFDVVDKIKDKFEILEREKIDLDEGGIEESIVFNSPMGKMKIVRTSSRPRVLDRRQQAGRHGIDPTEQTKNNQELKLVHQVEIFKWDNYADDWTKANLEF